MCQMGVLVEVALLIDLVILVILVLHSPCAPCPKDSRGVVCFIYFVNIGGTKEYN